MEIYFDGGCKPNPGEMEIAVVIPALDASYHERLSRGTNNQAEWIALLWAMEIALVHGQRKLTLIGDSELVIRQALGRYKVKEPTLIPYLVEFQQLRVQFTDLTLQHVKRDQNLAGTHIERVNREERKHGKAKRA